jgi:hypothetical protein
MKHILLNIVGFLILSLSCLGQTYTYNFFVPATVKEYDENEKVINVTKNNRFVFGFVSENVLRLGGGNNLDLKVTTIELTDINYFIGGKKHTKEGLIYTFNPDKEIKVKLYLVYHTYHHCVYDMIFYRNSKRLISFSGEFLLTP